jgi:predicted esterase
MRFDTHQLPVPRTARFVTSGNLGGTIEAVWFVHHGYGQLASEFLEKLRPLEQPNRLLVAPEALSRFYHRDNKTVGASWMTREDRLNEISDYIRYLDLVHDQIFQNLDEEFVAQTILGFSQGAATAARWACQGKAKVKHLILWGELMPPELADKKSLAPLKGLRLTLVHGTDDPLVPEAALQEQRDRLSKNQIEFEEIRFKGGHRLDNEILSRLATT